MTTDPLLERLHCNRRDCGCPMPHVYPAATSAETSPTPVPSTLPSAAPWYAQGSTADFSMSDVFAFAQVLDNLDAFEDVSAVLYYFEKPWKWTGERDRWVEIGSPSKPDEDQTAYVLDNGTKAPDYTTWRSLMEDEGRS